MYGRRRWWVLAFLVVAGVALSVLLRAAGVLAPDGRAAVDRPPAPDVTLVFADGRIERLADLRGRPIVLNFWASWCPACVAEMPDFQEVHAAFGDAVVFVGVNLQDDPGAAAELVARTGVEYPIAVDADGSLFETFGGIAMPTTVFIDAEGRIVDRHDGVLFVDELAARVSELVGRG